tara:strand:+ start:530 stop:1183 length:654 start_codon:yes stop_codon:yes gene_type:complete
MSITFGGTDTAPKQRTNIGIDNARVISANIVYNKAQKWQKKPDDIGIEMKIDIGKSFQPDFYIGGWFKRDDVSGNAAGWGSAYKVKIFLDSVGFRGAKLDYNKPPQQQTFPEDLSAHLTGKVFTRLCYKTTKMKDDGSHYWRDWQQVAPENNFEELRTAFNEAISHRDPASNEPAPFIKNFLHPDQEEEMNVSVPVGEEKTATTNPTEGAVPTMPNM